MDTFSMIGMESLDGLIYRAYTLSTLRMNENLYDKKGIVTYDPIYI